MYANLNQKGGRSVMQEQQRSNSGGKYHLAEVKALIHWLKNMEGVTKFYIKRAQRLDKRARQIPTLSCRFCDDGLLIRVRQNKLMQVIIVHANEEDSKIIYQYLQKEDFKSQD